MTTNEQYQSNNIYQNDGKEDDSRHEQQDDCTSVYSSSSSSSQPTVRRSRFFRSKRKQRLTHEQDLLNPMNSNEDVSTDFVYSSESPGKNIVQR
jgi:hypothetical protein